MAGAVGIRLRKDSFFDRQAVKDAVGSIAAYNLSRGGSFIRQTARRSMRTRRKPSAPGTPPSAHSKAHQEKAGLAKRGPLLKDKLFFQYDHASQSVVVGPEALPGSKNPVPEMHEYGGQYVVRKRVIKPKVKRKPATPKQLAALELLRRNGMLKKQSSTYVNVTARYPARPFMGPALEKETPKLVGVWADSVKP